LDRVLISKDWEDMFPTVFLHKLPRDLSDHTPLILSSDTNQPLRNLSFKLETSWIKHPDFLDKVREIWQKSCFAMSTPDRIQAKLKRFKQIFKGWGFNIEGERRKRKMLLQKELLSLE